MGTRYALTVAGVVPAHHATVMKIPFTVFIFAVLLQLFPYALGCQGLKSPAPCNGQPYPDPCDGQYGAVKDAGYG